MTQLNIGVIGVGHMGALHVETLERLEETRLVAVADPNEVAARKCIGRRPIAWHSDHRELLARRDLDAVTICTPSTSHADIALEAIEAGLHVFVEKPIAIALDDGLRMSAAAKVAGVKLMVGHIERFNPVVTRLAALILEGYLGRVYRVHATRVGPLPVRSVESGVTIDLATHDLDIMQFVLGRPIMSLYAEGRRFEHPCHEDLITCLLRFGDDGPVGLLDVNWLTPEKRRELTVVGERGVLTASYLTQDLWLTESAGTSATWRELTRLGSGVGISASRLAITRVEPLQAELAAFARCVLDDTDEPVSAETGCQALAAARAVLESVNSGRPVEVTGASELHRSPGSKGRAGAHGTRRAGRRIGLRQST